MFTGMVDHCGIIREIEQRGDHAQFVIETRFEQLEPGESIAVDGVCLTVVAPKQGQFSCDLSLETLGVTKLGRCKVGSKVNLERSLRASDRIGGHFVSGHVEAVATVTAVTPNDDFHVLTFGGLAPAQLSLMILKGSIAVNGVSLTINRLTDNGFEVMLIPHTLETTNLKELRVGDQVNLEFDMLAKMVAQQLKQAEVVYD